MSTEDRGGLIFRRYRQLPNGKVLDAYDYGLKAWPMRIGAGNGNGPRRRRKSKRNGH